GCENAGFGMYHRGSAPVQPIIKRIGDELITGWPGLTAYYRVLSRKAESWDLDSAPTLAASTSPFLNTVRVGMPRTPYLRGVSGFSSMFSLAMVSLSAYSLDRSSRIGATILHGPHHGAQ